VHEMGLCEAIVEATLRRANGRAVKAVRVRVGGHQVNPGVIDQAFRLAAAGTVAADADIDLVVTPPTVRCRGCGRHATVADAFDLAVCSQCGSGDVEVTGTDEVVLESITLIRAPEPADGAERG
jgi:hydrogenase nickel incorporation protein HypA/HybF